MELWVHSNQIEALKIKFDKLKDLQIIKRYSADYENSHNVIVARSQFPITLAWAITIHKSQGLTLKSVLIDLGASCWQVGMGYVALSRCQTLDKVFLLDFVPTILNL